VFTRNALAPVNSARTKFVSFDTIPPAPEIMRAGKVQVLIGQKYFGWGSEPVRLLAGFKAGKLPAKSVIDSGVDVVTPENLEAYVTEWAKLDKP
jgi:ribose transport system substrate-binding protein